MARPKTVRKIDRGDATAMLAEARRTVSYDPETGVFRWLRYRAANAHAGDCAGSIGGGGYRYVRIGGLQHRANRLAWLMMTEAWPSGQVDHIDGDTSNDRWANLRDATPGQNCANARRRRDNSTGIKGVRRMNSRWQVRLGKNGARHVGTFDTLEEAAAAYERAALALYGDFARVE